MSSHKPCVYRMFNAAGELLYVGQSVDFPARLRQHRQSQLWAGEIAAVTFSYCDDAAEANDQERAAIADERPRHNYQAGPATEGGTKLSSFRFPVAKREAWRAEAQRQGLTLTMFLVRAADEYLAVCHAD